jgi:hypothetical protein
MALLRRAHAAERPFWRNAPICTNDPEELQFYGITCWTRDGNGKAVMSCGWTLWGMGGLHLHQAGDLLSDGYQQWEPFASTEERIAFLQDVFTRSAAQAAPYPPDVYSAPPEAVVPAAAIYRARCWSGVRLVEEVSGTDEYERARRRVYDAIRSGHPGFIPGRGAEFMRSFEADGMA